MSFPEPAERAAPTPITVLLYHEAKDSRVSLVKECILQSFESVKVQRYKEGLFDPEKDMAVIHVMMPVTMLPTKRHPLRRAFRHFRTTTIYLDDGVIQLEEMQYVNSMSIVKGISKGNSENRIGGGQFRKKLIGTLNEKRNIIEKSANKNEAKRRARDLPMERAHAEWPFSYYKLFLEKAETHFSNQGGMRDFEKINQLKRTFIALSKKLTKLLLEYDNFCYDFLEVIEDKKPFEVSQERFVLTLPMKHKNHENIKKLSVALSDLVQSMSSNESVESLSNRFMALPNVNVRNANEQDLFLYECESEKDFLVFQKKAINNLILCYKILWKNFPNATRHLSWLLQSQLEVVEQPSSFDYKVLLMALLHKDSVAFRSHLKNQKPIIESNFELLQNLESLVSELERKYVSLLDNSLFRVYNDLRQASGNYRIAANERFKNHPEHKAMNEWAGVYEDLMNLIGDKLAELDITILEPVRGDLLDLEKHNPYIEAEPDPGLMDEQIKETVNCGFQTIERVLRPADVIVVRN